jgi:tRNA(Ile)-lysidine synthase TilS/MesJ
MNIQSALRSIRKADEDFGLIDKGDKICVAVSGGKDSLLLFLALSMYQKFEHTDFELVGIHVDVGFEEFEHEKMKEFAQRYNLDLRIIKTKIFDILKMEKNLSKSGKIQCSLCSKLKKGVLFEEAKKLGCKKIALGHHADDAVETLLMNMIHGSKIATFQPKQYMSRMEMYMIRPLVYMKESQVIALCENNCIDPVRRVCPNDGFTQRQSSKDVLEKLYALYPQAQENFITALSNTDQVSLWQKENSNKNTK